VARTFLWGLMAYSFVDFALIRWIDRGNRKLTAPGT
jgi:hypothetical protein